MMTRFFYGAWLGLIIVYITSSKQHNMDSFIASHRCTAASISAFILFEDYFLL